MKRRIILAVCFLIGHAPERIDETSDGEFTYYDLRCSRCGGKVRR